MLPTENVQIYKGRLPEFSFQAVIVERNLAGEKRTEFKRLATKAGTYSDGDIEKQTRNKKLEILSDIDQMLSVIGEA